MRLSFLSASVMMGLAAFVAAEGDSDVIDLTATNFDEVTKAEPLILVEFFAPWCGHCKALAPHYEESATALKEKNIKLAKVDCVDNSELCQTHGVSGYPTIKVFKHGTASDYSGPRKADGIISYMIKQSLPAVSTVTAASHAEFKDSDKVVVVAYVNAATDEAVAAFEAVAEKHRDDWLFGMSTDAAAIAEAKVTPPAVVIYKKFDERRNDLTGKGLTEESLAAFIKGNSIPLIDEISGENYATYAETQLPLAYLFLDPTEAHKEEHIALLRPIATQHKGKINFVWIDALKFSEHAKALNLAETKWPSFVIQEFEKQMKYPFDQASDFSEKTIAKFVDQFASGKLEPKLKSAAVPESQDEPVFTLVTSQWDEVVMDTKKDVFVEFYAPWCGHCKRLKPTWDSLAEKYAEFKDTLTIAKMDATENDIPPSAPFRVSGFPTIKFRPAGSTEFVDYDGDRTMESLVEFVEKTAKNSLVSTKKPTEPEAAAPSQAVIVDEEGHEHVKEAAHEEL